MKFISILVEHRREEGEAQYPAVPAIRLIMKKIVISGSAKLRPELERWNLWWHKAGYKVLYYPDLIDSQVKFSAAYKETYENFYKSLLESDLLFVMNETKNGIEGYIGAQTFAEASYAVANNLVRNDKKINVIILNKPSKKVASYSEVTTWLELKWAMLFEDWKRDEEIVW